MIFTMVFAVTSCGTVFSTHEKSRSDKLYGILPLKKSEMIIGRYLYALIYRRGVRRDHRNPVTCHVTCYRCNFGFIHLLGTLGAGVYLFRLCRRHIVPRLSKVFLHKSLYFHDAAGVRHRGGALTPDEKNEFYQQSQPVIRFFTDNSFLIPVFGILIGLILLAVSALIANLIYTRKEI